MLAGGEDDFNNNHDDFDNEDWDDIENNHHSHRGSDNGRGFFFYPGSVEQCIAGPGPMMFNTNNNNNNSGPRSNGKNVLKNVTTLDCFIGLASGEDWFKEIPDNQHCPYIGLNSDDLVANEINCANSDFSLCKQKPGYMNVANFLQSVGEEIKKAIANLDNNIDEDSLDNNTNTKKESLRKHVKDALALEYAKTEKENAKTENEEGMQKKKALLWMMKHLEVKN